MENEVIGLFPTPVARYRLNREFTDKELQFLGSLEFTLNSGNSVSKERTILKHKALGKISQFSEECVAHYLRTIVCPKHQASLRITQSWLNRTKKGNHHHRHQHPNSFISGVLYVKADAEKDKILFFSRVPAGEIVFESSNLNMLNSGDWWLPVATGDLLLFPSTLEHAVPSIETDDRISLSFNTFPTGYLGEEEKMTAVRL